MQPLDSELRQVDRYEIRGTLGEGAMGKVLLAFDPKLHREVALKIITEAAAAKDKNRERFHREARAIAALHHPNIVEIYDYSGADSQYLYLVMERLQGIDLFDLMDRFGALPEPIVAAVGHELCLALEHAHNAGVIHRDLKPENVFIDQTGRVVLTDFGIAKAFTEDNILDGPDWSPKTEVIGTPGFMAPEQMLNRTLGPRTDIFALGALLYNVLTGALPFEGPNPTAMFKAIASGALKDPRGKAADVSDAMVQILSQCLQAKPKKRPRSMGELRERFKEVLAANGVADLRDDLREFLRDPPGYRTRAHQRTVAYLLERLKIALKDRDRDAAHAIHQRLLVIDPANQDFASISGVFPALSPEQQRALTQGLSAAPFMRRWYAWPALLVGFVLLVAAIYAVIRIAATHLAESEAISGDAPPAAGGPRTPGATKGPRTPGAVRDPAGSSPAASADGPSLDLAASGQAQVLVAGQALTRGQAVAVPAGPQKVQVKPRRGKPFNALVSIPERGSGTLVVDLKRRRVTLDWRAP